MKVKDFLAKVAYIQDLEIAGGMYPVYKSNFNDSYITHVGMEDNIKFLAEREITEELTHGVGFSPKDGKWYGWSHRAIYGFKVGSTCKKGDCHYRAANLEDEIEDAIRFWSDDNNDNVTAALLKNNEIEVVWRYNKKPKNKKIHGTVSSVIWKFDPDNFGRGEWTAETMQDAKQMAIDFNEGVS